MWLIIFFVSVITLLLYILIFGGKNFFWEKYGVEEIDTSSVLSGFEVLVLGKSLSIADNFAYEVLGDGKFCGAMEMGKPKLILKDIELIKKIMIKDFEYFTDRREFFNDQNSALGKMLSSLEGEEWKGVRTSVSPIFTTGKIRRMMEIFNSVGKEWVAELSKKAAPQGSVKIDVVTTVNQYTIDVIASTVFGVEGGTVKNPNSIFAQMAGRVVELNKWKIAKFTLSHIFPSLFALLKIPLIDAEAMNFFEQIFLQGFSERMKGNMKRNDFLQLLVETRKGELKAVGNDELSAFEKDGQIPGEAGTGDKKHYLTDEMMSAQSLVFFLAGFTTTSNFISNLIYMLALHPQVQEKARAEVEKILKEDGSLDYDDLGKLPYLEMIFNETLRKFPALARLERKCVKDYKDPDIGLTVPKGIYACIPVTAIHNDKQYYEQPEKFYPEHFAPERKQKRSPYAFLPFGMGPRNCIGMRFALVESKAAIAHLLHHFTIEPTEKTPVPIQHQITGINVLPPDNLEVKLVSRALHE